MDDKEPATIKFEYKISPAYAVYAVTGVHGGLNAQGDIVMNFFNERGPIPKYQTYRILPNGNLEDSPIDQEVKPGAIRDVFFGVSMSPATGRALAAWLLRQAETLEQKLAEAFSREQADGNAPKPH